MKHVVFDVRDFKGMRKVTVIYLGEASKEGRLGHGLYTRNNT